MDVLYTLELIMDDTEFRKCVFDFAFFAKTYIKVQHPKRGLVGFDIYPYHERVSDIYARERFTILKKFRQAGLSTMTLAWLMWKAMFQFDQRILWVAKTDREAMAAGKIVNSMIRSLPEWLAPVMAKDNAHEKHFMDTGSQMIFMSPVACRSRAADWLVLDECAFIPKMDDWWQCIYPTLCNGGKCIALSTPNGRGNWFEKTYTGAQEGKNMFHVVDVNYMEHPDYQSEEWAAQMKKNLGLVGWTQEVLASFD